MKAEGSGGGFTRSEEELGDHYHSDFLTQRGSHSSLRLSGITPMCVVQKEVLTEDAGPA